MTADSQRAEVARRWTRALIRTSYVPMSRAEVQDFLHECLDDLVTSLLADEFSSKVAEDVGGRLVRAYFVTPEGLARSLQLLATELPGFLPDPGGGREHLPELIGAVGRGFTAAHYANTLRQQETIKHAVLQARDAAEGALAASEARFRAVFNSSLLGIALVSLDGVLEDVNAAMARIFRCETSELVGRDLFELVDPGWTEDLRVSEADLVTGALEQFQVKTRFCAQDGTQIWTQIWASLVRSAEGEPAYQVLLYEDITERHMLQEQMHRQATHDPLTGLANRTLLQTRMESALRPTSPGRRVGLCYFDLDGFKAINDSLGHEIGDMLLRAVAQRLRGLAIAEGALVARLGGDEFVVLVQDSRGAKHLVELVERLLREISKPTRIGPHELNASASAGVVEYEVAQTSTQQLLRDADITLYRAKNEGKAQWVLFEPEINEASRHRFQLSTAMPAALDGNEFFVEYWPVLLLENGRLCTLEAVVRWDHPEFGELNAVDFLDLALETGLIAKLGSWFLHQACEHAKGLHDRLGPAAPGVAVSLSKRQFRDPELIGEVRRVLRETGLPPELLRLTVAESGLTDPKGQPLDHIELLNEMGVTVGVSDFGGQFPQMGHLRDLSVQAVKIRASYGEGSTSHPDPVDEHVVSSLVTGARLLGMYVVVEGVETAEQAEWLRKLGVYAVLGPHAGELASALEIEAMISAGKLAVQ